MTKTKRINWTVEKRKLADLKEHENNPRQFTEKGMKDLENSINSIGFMQPININQDGTILSGHARTKKLKDMGEVEVDVYVPDRVLTPKQEEEVLVRANANTAGQWDFDILANNFDLEEITDWGLDVPDMDLDIEEEAEVEEDEVPELKHKFAVKGDLFELVDEEQGLTHRVLCGDSTMIDDVEKVMNGEKANLMITDLPYGVSYADKNNFLNNLDKGNRIQKEIKNDHITPNELYDFAKNIYIPAYSIMNKKNSYYAFMPQGGEQMMMMMALKDSGFQVKHELIWLKNNHVLGRADYCYKHEPICYGWTDKGTHEFYSKDFKVSVLEFSKPVSNDLHPTMKPISILTELITNSSKQKFIIYDPTLGSGSTLIACQQTKRNCYGIELDEHYCGVIVKRWLNYMQKENKAFKIKRNDEDFDIKEIDKGGEFS